MYSSKFAGFHQKLFFEIARNPSVYAALSDICVIITRASIFLTIPVVFIYTFLLKLQIVLLVFVNQKEIYTFSFV